MRQKRKLNGLIVGSVNKLGQLQNGQYIITFPKWAAERLNAKKGTRIAFIKVIDVNNRESVKVMTEDQLEEYEQFLLQQYQKIKENG